jgi:hypothetical protein
VSETFRTTTLIVASADERARWFIQRVLMVPRSLLSFRSRMASLQVLQQLDLILSAEKVVSTGGSVSVMV